MLRCVIVDDEPLAQDVIEQHLRSVNSIALDHKFSNAFDALEYLNNKEVDIIFLDIEMPEMNGIDFLKLLDNPPITVFTTAYRNYAFDGYELGVIDFLLKPVSEDRFGAAIEKINDFFALKAQRSQIEAVQELKKHIFIKSGVEKIKVNIDEISHIQGLKDYAIIHTSTGKIVTKGSVKAMQELFSEKNFIRVHKSFIVAKSQIYHISKNKIVFKNFQIPIGRNYKDQVEQLLKA